MWDRWIGVLLRGYPRRFRDRFGDDLRAQFRHTTPSFTAAIAALKDLGRAGLGARLDDARTQLDYALVAMLLAMLSCAAWLVLLVLTDTSWLRFLLVAFAAWLGFHLFYRVALEAQRTVTETMKAMLDRYRWDVLEALHVAVPADSAAERALWQRLQSVSASVRLPTPLPYEKGQ